MNKTAIRCIALSFSVLALQACQREGAGAGSAAAPASAAATVPVAADAAFTQAQQAWRDQRRENLLKPDGWTSLIGLHWVEPGPHYFGSAADNGIRLAMGPAHFGMIDLRKNGSVRLVPERDAQLTLDEQPLKGAVTLVTDADESESGPSRIGFDEGKGLATVIKRGGRYALRVKHADAPTRTGFTGLEYWQADPSWKIEGKFVPHPAGKTIQIADIIGTLNDVPNPGAIEFQRDGRTYRLEALDEGEEELFLVFGDRSNGHGSYSAGRFLYAPRPDAQGRVVLDFNRSYNPPCAFTPFATCPLPPQENRLDLAILAGEKAYPKAAH
ncbi:DUF1684 domain-containing protein [Luteimonas sp. SX5]|uniref:DUF1684 domain-containing protein n=1 Tax=Luteimonas galliterrae TaxID=2940486 RepID=A0ABT0MFA8_9GAMM|nr:DUF1684 domain-containing protein [Luteimonas galliterrae]MCL1633283.1 DUF1684 domain-containing protein [Luteimonas galliterrae]